MPGRSEISCRGKVETGQSKVPRVLRCPGALCAPSCKRNGGQSVCTPLGSSIGARRQGAERVSHSHQLWLPPSCHAILCIRAIHAAPSMPKLNIVDVSVYGGCRTASDLQNVIRSVSWFVLMTFSTHERVGVESETRCLPCKTSDAAYFPCFKFS